MYRFAACLCLLFQLAACSSLLHSKIMPIGTTLRSVSISADTDANHNMATAVDLIFVDDSELSKTLPKNSLDWFAQKTQLLGAHPKSLVCVALEIPPEKTLHDVALPWRWYWMWKQPYEVSVYLKYFTKQGQNRFDLTPFSHAHIRLQAETVEVGELVSK